MSAYHSLLRNLHITCAIASISLFVLRHILSLYKVDWRRFRALRIMPHAIDSLLLISAVLLSIIVGQYPFVDAWLTVKVIALVAYIVLGMQALKRDRPQGARRIAFIAAVTVFLFIISVARTHSPLGVLVTIFG